MKMSDLHKGMKLPVVAIPSVDHTPAAVLDEKEVALVRRFGQRLR